MVTVEDFECWFHQSVLNSTTEPTKEKRMNTYTITAKALYDQAYTVEAETEEEAINKVEWGEVDWDENEFNGELDDIEVVDVEYGDVKRYGKLGVNFVTRGKIGENNIIDALYSLLAQFDGKTIDYGDGELELVGFSVDHVEEA